MVSAAQAQSVPENCVCVWLIGNPTSGGGRGQRAIEEASSALRKVIGGHRVRHDMSSRFLSIAEDACLREIADGMCHYSPVTPQNLYPHDLAPRRPMHAVTIRTERGGDGMRVAYRVARLVALSRTFSSNPVTSRSSTNVLHPRDPASATAEAGDNPRTPPANQCQWLHIVIVVGGDGTLSEVVNGLCRGTLAAHRTMNLPAGHLSPASPSHRGSHAVVHVDELDVDVDLDSVFQAATDAVVSGKLSPQSVSEAYYWQMQRDRAVLRHLLPRLLYIPGGTGSDFAKLQLCCNNADECIEVLNSVAADSFPTGKETPSDALAMSSCRHYRVDIGRVTFPRTGRTHFFINECSIGMSCNVIKRGERFKRIGFIAAMGGLILFLLAGAVSLVLMRPKIIRMMRLPATTVAGDEEEKDRGDAEADLWSDLTACDRQQSVREHVLAARTKDLPAMDELREYNYYRYAPHTGQLPSLVGGPDGSHAAAHAQAVPFPDTGSPEGIYPCNGQPEQSFFYAIPPSGEIRDGFGEPHPKSRRWVAACGGGGGGGPGCPSWLKCSTPAAIRSALDIPPRAAAASTVASHCPTPLQWVYLQSSTFAFGNGRWYGGGMQVTPHADPTDGLLSCTNWVTTFLPVLFRFGSMYSGKHVQWSSTSTLDGERFIVDAGPYVEGSGRDNCVASSGEGSRKGDYSPMLMEADGELLEMLPAVVEIGGSIEFLVPVSRSPRPFGQPIAGTRRWFLARAARGEVVVDAADGLRECSTDHTHRFWGIVFVARAMHPLQRWWYGKQLSK